MLQTVADRIYYTAVNLVCMNGASQVGTGTGFFWNKVVPETNQEVTVIVTNKHVVSGATHLAAMCHELDSTSGGPSGKSIRCNMALYPGAVINHPDPAIDLCAIAFGPVLQNGENRGTPLFIQTISAENIPAGTAWEEDFDSIEEVIMVGCPRGIYDQTNNLPIVRRGITATPLGMRYEGRPEFMVDMACFPGSSGSPVFMLQRGYLDRKQCAYTLGERFYFLGVLYCGPVIKNDGHIVLTQQPRVAVDAMMHLGQVIRSTALLGLDAELMKIAGLPVGSEAALAALQAGPTDRAYTA